MPLLLLMREGEIPYDCIIAHARHYIQSMMRVGQ